jgi:hypothetical protein
MQLVQKCLDGGSAAGTVLMDAPAHSSVEELLGLANDRQLWNGVCNAMCPKLKGNRLRVQKAGADTNQEAAKSYVAKMQRDLVFKG